MFASILAFFTQAAPLLLFASNILPVLAVMRSQNDPSVSNAGLLNMMKAIQFVQPLVAHVEAVSNAGQTKLTGPEKLQLFQAVLAEAQAASAGHDGNFAQVLPLLNAAVTAVCASMKIQTLTPVQVSGVVNSQPTATVAQGIQPNNA